MVPKPALERGKWEESDVFCLESQSLPLSIPAQGCSEKLSGMSSPYTVRGEDS